VLDIEVIRIGGSPVAIECSRISVSSTLFFPFLYIEARPFRAIARQPPTRARLRMPRAMGEIEATISQVGEALAGSA
jgi:hypothetical protein